MENYKKLPPAVKREFWQRQIDGWRSSGQSQAEYCRRQKLTKSAFGYWRTRLARETGLVEIKPLHIKVEAQATIDIIVRGGLRVRVQKGFDADLLVETIQALGRLSC